MHTDPIAHTGSRNAARAARLPRGGCSGRAARDDAVPGTAGPAFAALVFGLFVAGFSGAAEPIVALALEALATLADPAG